MNIKVGKISIWNRKILIIFSNLNYNCFNVADLWKLQEQVQKSFCFKTRTDFPMFDLNCSSDFKFFEMFSHRTVSETRLSEKNNNPTFNTQCMILNLKAMRLMAWKFEFSILLDIAYICYIQPERDIETLAIARNSTTGKLLNQGNNKLNTCQSENELTL